jgi:hypothetical protein
MANVVITAADFPPAKINTQQLQQEIAAALKIDPSLVVMNIAQDAQRTHFIQDKDTPQGTSTTTAIAKHMNITVPDDANPVTVLTTVKAHAPTHDDHEAGTVAATASFDTLIASSATIQALTARLVALEGKSK